MAEQLTNWQNLTPAKKIALGLKMQDSGLSADDAMKAAGWDKLTVDQRRAFGIDNSPGPQPPASVLKAAGWENMSPVERQLRGIGWGPLSADTTKIGEGLKKQYQGNVGAFAL